MQEALAVTKWLCMCLMVSFLMRPYLRTKVLRLVDGGFAASLGLGCALSFFFTYIVSAIFSLPFNTVCCVIGLIFTAAVPIVVHLCKYKSLREYCRMYLNVDLLRRYLIAFGVFAVFLVTAVWLWGYNGGITSTTEQYMDYGFMTSMYRQQSVIPEDLWFIGHRLNYYYLGQAAAVYLCRLAHVTPEYGYFLMVSTMLPFLLMSVFSLVEAILKSAYTKKAAAVFGGVVSACLVTLGGNLHYILYGIVDPILTKLFGISINYKDAPFFYPDSTVFIGYYPDLGDHGKHEYPAYSLVLGDLHAHFIDLLFVLPLLIILFDLVLSKDSGQEESEIKKDAWQEESEIKKNAWQEESETEKSVWKEESEIKKNVWLRELTDSRVWLLGILLGLFRGVNYWDFPIYFVVCGACILFSDIKKKGWSVKCVGLVLLKGILIALIGTVLIMPFMLHFTKMSSEIVLCKNHSPFVQFMLIWGVQIFIVACFLLSMLVKRIAQKKKYSQPDVVLWAFMLCAVGLLIVPEIVYVRDIYEAGNARFNTMFKLTYEGFVLLGISIGIIGGICFEQKKRASSILLMIYTILVTGYIITAVFQARGNVFTESRLSCKSNVRMAQQENADVIRKMADYINQDDAAIVHLAEYPGYSYTDSNSVSVFTGASDVMGWQTHEWLWRSDWSFVAPRLEEMIQFYTLGDLEYCAEVIQKYKLDYIVVGPSECGTLDVDISGFETFCREALDLSEYGDGRYHLYEVIL